MSLGVLAVAQTVLILVSSRRAAYGWSDGSRLPRSRPSRPWSPSANFSPRRSVCPASTAYVAGCRSSLPQSRRQGAAGLRRKEMAPLRLAPHLRPHPLRPPRARLAPLRALLAPLLAHPRTVRRLPRPAQEPPALVQAEPGQGHKATSAPDSSRNGRASRIRSTPRSLRQMAHLDPREARRPCPLCRPA